MVSISESSSETNHFIFFDEYAEERFEEFASLVLRALNVKGDSREAGPYSVLVSACYEGYNLILTDGSFEGCFISIEKNGGDLSKKIIERFNHKLIGPKATGAAEVPATSAIARVGLRGALAAQAGIPQGHAFIKGLELSFYSGC